jgi:ABC-2 type transport system permease protein
MNTSKLWLIIQREYLTRVKGKGFIISTLLAPIFLLAIFLVPILMSNFESSSSESRYVLVDETGAVADRMVQINPSRYEIRPEANVEELRDETLDGKINGYILLPAGLLDGSRNAELYNTGSGGITLAGEIRDNLRSAVREELLARTSVSDDVKAIFDMRPSLDSRRISAEGDSEVDEGINFIIAYIMGFAIYMAMFSYGALIMQGVMEEKTNRIMEIIISSARPMELLLGKVVGIVALGLTQITIWFIAFTGISAIVGPIALMMMGQDAPDTSSVAGAAAASPAGDFSVPEISISIWIFFAIFYVLGFLIYGGVFAAVGAAADSPQDTQQLALPIYIPIMIPIFLMMPVVTDPHSNLAVISSMIPFFSPILMMGRIAVTDVPLWQSLGSIVLMVGTFLALMWMSGKIYRVGVLMYGKKVTLSEVVRWLRY